MSVGINNNFLMGLWSGNFFSMKSWAIVSRGTSKMKIWLGTFFGSVLTIFITFSGSLFVFSGLVIDTITGPRCRLLIRDVVYKSAGVNYWSEEKIKMLETYPKKVPSQKTFLLVHLGTMTFHKLRFQFWTPRLKKALFMLFLLVINIIGRGSKNLFKVAIPGEKIKRQCFGISRGDNQGSALIPKIYFSVLSFGYLTFNLLYAV